MYDQPGGYQEIIQGWDISVDALGQGEAIIIEAMEYINRPSAPEFIEGKIAEMKLLLVRRSEGEDDIEFLVSVLTPRLRKFPSDIVLSVIDNWIRTQKFFPTVSEIVPVMENEFMFREKMLEALRNNQGAKPAVTYEPNFREVPRERWKPIHFKQKIADCIAFADVHLKHTKPIDELGWVLTALKYCAEALEKFRDSDREAIAAIHLSVSYLAERQHKIEASLDAGSETENVVTSQ